MQIISEAPRIPRLAYTLDELAAFYPDPKYLTARMALDMIAALRAHRERDEWVREIGELLHLMAQERRVIEASSIAEIGEKLAMGMQ